MSARVKPSACRNCSKVMDSASQLHSDARPPSPGDIAICFYCHHIMAYADDLTLRELTDAEQIEIAADPEILASMRALGAFKKWEAKQ